MKERICGTTIHFEMLGEHGSRVLLLHGWGCDLTMMKPLGEQLSKEHIVLMVDFPGHGQSGQPPEPWGVPEYAGSLEELLDKLQFAPCSVIAHSFGCRVATWLAAEKPELFTRMIFTGAAGIKPHPSEESQRRNRQYKRLKQYCGYIRKIPGFSRTAADLEEKLRRKYGSPDYNALDEEMRKTFIKIINQDLSEYYSRIRQSTLLIWGDEDKETPLWMGKQMASSIPDAGLVVLEGGSHFAFLEQFQRFLTISLHFLKEEQ